MNGSVDVFFAYSAVNHVGLTRLAKLLSLTHVQAVLFPINAVL